MASIRRLQANPELGALRIHAPLERRRARCGARILEDLVMDVVMARFDAMGLSKFLLVARVLRLSPPAASSGKSRPAPRGHTVQVRPARTASLRTH